MTQGMDARSASGSGLAHMLLPRLLDACRGRLADVEWFHAPWQRGGAATARARWRLDTGERVHAFVKIPVGPVEYFWTTRLSAIETNLHTPRVYAHGEELAGVDLAWIVTEQLQGPLEPAGVTEQHVRSMLRACVAFQSTADQCVPTHPPAYLTAHSSPDWARTLARARTLCKADKIENLTRWQDVIHWSLKHLPHLVNHWERRPLNCWCHGDVHPGNAMRRAGEDSCVLIDLALVHRGHWMEDALYLERQFWGHREHLGGAKPLTLLANMRREAGLASGGDYGTLANVRRVLAACCVPALREREGNRAYVGAALELAERLIPQLHHDII